MPGLSFGQRLNMAWRMAVGAFPINAGSAAAGLIGGVVEAQPPARGSTEYLKAYSTMPWLRATTHRIAESVASTRWHVYVIRRGGRYRRTLFANEMPEIRRKMLREAKQNDELVEIEDSPLVRTLHGGNATLTSGSIRRVTQIYIDILGEAFWLKERNRAGAVETVWPIPPTWVRRTPSLESPVYEMQFRGWHGEIPDTEVLWFKDPDPYNPYGRGMGVAQSLADELEIDEYAAKHTKTFFYNGTTMSAVVSPRHDASHNTWSATQRRQLETSWNQNHRGFWKAFKTLFSPIPLEIQQLGLSPKDTMLGELRQQERDTIIQVLGIPPEIVGIVENSNRATIESSQYLFALNCLVPRLEHLRETLQQRLVPEYDDRLILDYDNPVPEDKEHKLNVARAQPQSLTQNEWREMSGHEETDTGNVFHLPYTVTPMESLGGMPQRPARQAAAATPRRSTSATTQPKSPPLLAKAPSFVDSAPDDEFYLLVHRVADRLIPRLQREFRRIIATAQESVSLELLEAALRSTLINRVEDVIPWQDITEALREASELDFLSAVRNAGDLAANEMGEQFGLEIAFNEASPAIAQFAQSHSALLVTRIDESSREAIRQAVARAFSEGRTGQQVAREIRDSIGLLPRQEAALAKFRQSLIDQGRSPSEVVRRTERYAKSLLRKRSQAIARTEMIDAASEGQRLLWNQAADSGIIDRRKTKRFWITTPDDRLDINVCEPIPFMNADGVGLNEPFKTPVGDILRPTAHPMCRCAVTLRVTDS